MCLKWNFANPYIQKIKVLLSDVDRLGHTNNGRYLAWLEDIAWNHIEALGCGWDQKQATGKAMAIIRTEIDYLAATYEGDELVLGTWITESDFKVRSVRNFQLVRVADNKTVLKARMLFSCISLKSGFVARMSPALVDAHKKGVELSQHPSCD